MHLQCYVCGSLLVATVALVVAVVVIAVALVVFAVPAAVDGPVLCLGNC